MSYHFSKAKRFILFFTGLLVAGFGVALSTRPWLETAPAASLPYVTTTQFPGASGMVNRSKRKDSKMDCTNPSDVLSGTAYPALQISDTDIDLIIKNYKRSIRRKRLTLPPRNRSLPDRKAMAVLPVFIMTMIPAVIGLV